MSRASSRPLLRGLASAKIGLTIKRRFDAVSLSPKTRSNERQPLFDVVVAPAVAGPQQWSRTIPRSVWNVL
jgi:hypothetical protein